MCEFYHRCAISTPLGEGAIGIVRLCGTHSFACALNFFKGKLEHKVQPHTLKHGHY